MENKIALNKKQSFLITIWRSAAKAGHARRPAFLSELFIKLSSPYINRFLQPDSIIPDLSSPQSWNRYSYVVNNPINAIDPTGHKCVGEPEECLKPNGKPINGAGGLMANKKTKEKDDTNQHQCTNILGQTGGCINYVSGSLGLDAPTIMMLSGAGLSFIGLPEAGAPIALAGAAFEACAFTATPLCAAVKLLSVNISGTLDEYGNLYLGPQISWGKSILPFVALSDYWGVISSGNDSHVPTETETKDTLSGFSVSAGSIATGGVSYSPFAQTYNTSYYLDGFPEVFSINVNYNFFIHDYSP
jgi:hypothetical protein